MLHSPGYAKGKCLGKTNPQFLQFILPCHYRVLLRESTIAQG